MGLYTSIYLTPVDARWIATPEIIIEIAALLRVTTVDIFTVSHEIELPCDAGDDCDEDDRYEDIFRCGHTPIDEALEHHRAGDGYRTHLMFPFGDFMKELADEIQAAIPVQISSGYIPWDASIYNGGWSVYSYDQGTIEDSGAFAFCMHGSGCPPGLERYLQYFLAVEGVKRFKAQLESLTHQSFKAIIDLT